MTRKLIRPNFSEIKEKMSKPAKKKTHPPYETYAENYYYLKQMNKKTPMVIVCNDGEILEGTIEWYDKECIKITRENAPNLLVYKTSIKYMYKQNENKDKEKKENNTEE